MAKSHPAQLDEQAAPQLPDWARNTMASFTLLTCLVSLNVILHNQHGVRVVGAVANGVAALDLAHPGLVGLAVFGVLRDGAVVPVPLDGRAIEVGVVVGAALHVDRQVHAKWGEAGGRLGLE